MSMIWGSGPSHPPSLQHANISMCAVVRCQGLHSTLLSMQSLLLVM